MQHLLLLSHLTCHIIQYMVVKQVKKGKEKISIQKIKSVKTIVMPQLLMKEYDNNVRKRFLENFILNVIIKVIKIKNILNKNITVIYHAQFSWILQVLVVLNTLVVYLPIMVKNSQSYTLYLSLLNNMLF